MPVRDGRGRSRRRGACRSRAGLGCAMRRPGRGTARKRGCKKIAFVLIWRKIAIDRLIGRTCCRAQSGCRRSSGKTGPHVCARAPRSGRSKGRTTRWPEARPRPSRCSARRSSTRLRACSRPGASTTRRWRKSRASAGFPRPCCTTTTATRNTSSTTSPQATSRNCLRSWRRSRPRRRRRVSAWNA